MNGISVLPQPPDFSDLVPTKPVPKNEKIPERTQIPVSKRGERCYSGSN
jgi:hypothetical protein